MAVYRRQGGRLPRSPTEGRWRQALGNRRQAGYRPDQPLSGHGSAGYGSGCCVNTRWSCDRLEQGDTIRMRANIGRAMLHRTVSQAAVKQYL
jgi:hypothetical protein